MPQKKRFKTDKGEREFDFSATQKDIEASFLKEGITEYEPVKRKEISIDDIKKEIGKYGLTPATDTLVDNPLSLGAAAGSFARPSISAGIAGAVMSRLPNPVARALGGILSYAATD